MNLENLNPVSKYEGGFTLIILNNVFSVIFYLKIKKNLIL